MSRKSDPFAVELNPELILRAYRAGIFPMAEDAASEDVFWVSPDLRGIIPLDAFHISGSLRKVLKSHHYFVRTDTDFAAVIEGCGSNGCEYMTGGTAVILGPLIAAVLIRELVTGRQEGLF